MATSKKNNSDSPEVVPISTETATMPSDEPPTPPSIPLSAFNDKAPKKKTDRLPFWEFLQTIPSNQWGVSGDTYLYLYISEPFCDIKSEGKPGYLMKYFEPVDQDAIMHRWGSGKYYMMLKRKRPGGEGDTTLKDHTFEIYNPEYPPKIPRSAWRKDSRNERWAAMLPKEKPEGDPGDPVRMFEVFQNIQDRAADRNKQPDASSQLGTVVDAASTLLEMVKPKETTGPGVDPWAAAEKILNMRSDNPMVTILSQQLDAMRKEAEAARTREYEMQKELRQMLTQPKADSGGLLEQLKALAAAKDTFKTLLGIKDDVAAAAPTIVKSKMSGTLEFLQGFIPQALNAPVLVNLSQALLYRITNPNPAQDPLNNPMQPMAPPQPAATTQGMEAFVRDTITPALISYLEEPASGTRFAEWLYAGFPERLQEMQNITHAQMPGMKGALVIQNFYRHSPIWVRIAGPQAMKLVDGKRVPLPPEEIPAREAAFQKFVEEFCAYDPDKEEEPISDAQETESESEAEEVNV